MAVPTHPSQFSAMLRRIVTALVGTEPLADAEEAAFLVFSHALPSQSLGFIDARAATLQLTVAGHDLLLRQSPGLLTSHRKEGTTGAVVWAITPLFASWIASPTNFLFTHPLLTPASTILELGAGVSGIVALTLGARVAHYTATDQDYVLKLLRQNIAENLAVVLPPQKKTSKHRQTQQEAHPRNQRILVEALDWETDSMAHRHGVDLVIACDCIYNEALIEPLNTTCAALCQLRSNAETPTLCLIAQQLRSPDVFEAWLKSFLEKFWVWQVPDELLDENLREGSGFVVHIGVLR